MTMNVDPEKAIEAVEKRLPITELYRDLAQPAAQRIGRGLGTVADAALLALIPLEWLVYKGGEIRAALMPDLEARLEGVPTERIQTPAPEVAGPLFEALRFTAHNDDLRRLYANLLGTAMDSETARTAHPAFVEILKQLSPDEARILRYVAEDGPYQPVLSIVELHEKDDEEKGLHNALSNFSCIADDAGCEHPDLVSTYITNLRRLGLVEHIDGGVAQPPSVYDPIEEHGTITALEAEIAARGYASRRERGLIGVTPLGQQFIDACVAPTLGRTA
ncbi:MAG: DUF4393 domain-containing protein [Dehalococcoidia bacterium]